MTTETAGSHIAVRNFEGVDQSFLARVAGRLRPAETASPRDAETIERYFADFTERTLLREPGALAFVAMLDAAPAGIIAVHPDTDYFTGHPRAYVDVLVVVPEYEGRGVGSALMDHVERWARQNGFREVVLDVFASNVDAIEFYRRRGYQPDHIRMAKGLN